VNDVVMAAVRSELDSHCHYSWWLGAGDWALPGMALVGGWLIG
jgi:hypothetical protein